MHRVIWLPEALLELAKLWTDAPDRSAVTAAAAAIDRRLASDPADAGESRAEGRRILIEPPLGVIFETHPQERIAVVIHAWAFAKRDRGR